MSLQINFTPMDDIVRRVKKMLKDEHLTFLDIKKIRERLLYCCEINSGKNFQLDLLLGYLDMEELKILQSQDIKVDCSMYLRSAKYHFKRALFKNEESFESIYGLFKIAIIEEDYKMAFFELNRYEQNEIRPNLNLSFVYKLLSYFLERKKITFEKRVDDSEIAEYEPLKRNYLLAEKAFQEKNYRQVVKHLNVCQHLGKKKQFDFDFSPLMILGQRIFEIELQKQKENLKKKYASERDMGNRMMIAWELLDLDATDIETYFLLMDTYMDLNAYTPIESYLEKIKNIPTWLEHEERILQYEKIYNEKMMEDQYMQEIEQILHYGLCLKEKGDYKMAVDIYEKGYHKYHYPYFYLKISEIYYLLENYPLSTYYAKTYLQEGIFAWEEASLILYKSYRKMGDLSTAIKVVTSYFETLRMSKRGKNLKIWLEEWNEKYLEENETTPEGKAYQNRKKEG